MARGTLVNLDAMLPREDFALVDDDNPPSYEKFERISVKDLKEDGIIPLLRKPDFQRETNHWTPEQVASLLECFVNGDLIPSVIVWKSPTYLFVIDGGHRLSALRAWLLDDYGDAPTSLAFFGRSVSNEQERAAQRTRELVSQKIGNFKHFQARLSDPNLDDRERRRINTVLTRGIPVQWVEGNAEKAEASFFKINTKGTPLDDIEELLLSNRRKPIAVASRAVIRAGMGHRYWSRFPSPTCDEVEQLAKTIHSTLFEPEYNTPVKTLDLPLGGSSGVRAALQVLIEFMLFAIRNQANEPKHLKDQADDPDGSSTKEALREALNLALRMTGNDKGSLGLHPAIYFYGPTGRHLSPMFLGMALLLSRKMINNDKGFFEKFTKVRSKLEDALIAHKDLVATILQKTISRNRVQKYASLIDSLVGYIVSDPNSSLDDAQIVSLSGLSGKIITGSADNAGKDFSDETKSAVFINAALKGALRCPICNGFLDSAKSISYDHIRERARGGLGSEANCQLTHPYCNQAVKNKLPLTP
ncbi:HNH endonuclease [Roseimicrobium gellanilyticum]|uniref:HNH endonuclease n=1 Tax=Roseimicrobium gellanilyticum TaxID=748857 RepID=A0A366HDK1_9BACT|nr:DUF262 domain-containing protein [Roseimicrobium gellanilyticum]RBP39805.1 HNH endonuclease [Roseimicrobium gellanilyticum]